MDGLKVDKPLDREAFEVGSSEENEGLIVDELNVDWLEDNEGLIVGRLAVDRVEVKEGLSVESIGYTLEGSEGAGADEEGRAGVAVCSWHFPLVIETSSIAMWLWIDPAIPSNVT